MKRLERVARALYEIEPFYMPTGQIQDGIEIARKFSFDDAPAHRQHRAYELAKAALAAIDGSPSRAPVPIPSRRSRRFIPA